MDIFLIQQFVAASASAGAFRVLGLGFEVVEKVFMDILGCEGMASQIFCLLEYGGE